MEQAESHPVLIQDFAAQGGTTADGAGACLSRRSKIGGLPGRTRHVEVSGGEVAGLGAKGGGTWQGRRVEAARVHDFELVVWFCAGGVQSPWSCTARGGQLVELEGVARRGSAPDQRVCASIVDYLRGALPRACQLSGSRRRS
jgi:hypothetical protein